MQWAVGNSPALGRGDYLVRRSLLCPAAGTLDSPSRYRHGPKISAGKSCCEHPGIMQDGLPEMWREPAAKGESIPRRCPSPVRSS